MRLALAAAALLLVVQPTWADDAVVSGIKGPAAKAILAYLTSEKVDCPANPDSKCSALDTVIDARVYYGRFPGEVTSTAVAFIDEDSGGSGASLTAMVWREDGQREFRLVGETEAIGDNARDVRFLPDRSISYIGTVMRSGDSHASPSGHRRFRLALTSIGVSFLDR